MVFNQINDLTKPTNWQQINVLPEAYNYRRRMFVSGMILLASAVIPTLAPTILTWDGDYIKDVSIEKRDFGLFERKIFEYPVIEKEKVFVTKAFTRGFRTTTGLLGLLGSTIVLIRVTHDEEMQPIRETQLQANYNLAAQLIGLAEHDIIQSFLPEETNQSQQSLRRKVKTSIKINIGHFDPRLLRNHKDYPHISVRGKTRSGKTWSTMKILKVLGGCQIVIAPKLNPKKKDWEGYQIIHHSTADQAPIEGAEVVDNLLGRLEQAFNNSEKIIVGTGYEYSAILITLQWAVNVMKFCQKNRDFEHPPIQIVLDDVNTYSEVIPGFGGIIKDLAIMAADADIRIWGLSHLLTANAYGLKKGDAGILSNFVNLNIGGMAIRQAQLLFRNSLDSQEAGYYQACIEYLKKAKERERCFVEVDGLGYVMNYQQLDLLQNFDDGEILPLPDMYDDGKEPYVFTEEIEEDIPDEIEDSPQLPPAKDPKNTEPKNPEIDPERNQKYWDELTKRPDSGQLPNSDDSGSGQVPEPEEKNTPEPTGTIENKEVQPSSSAFLPRKIHVFCEKYKLDEKTVLGTIQHLIYVSKEEPENKNFDGYKSKVLKEFLLVSGRKFSEKGQDIWGDLLEIILLFTGENQNNNDINLGKNQ